MSQRKKLVAVMLLGLLVLGVLVGVFFQHNTDSDSTTTRGNSGNSGVWIPISIGAWIAAMIPIIAAQKQRKGKHKNEEGEFFE